MQRSPTCAKCLRNYEFKDLRPVGPHIPLLLSCGHSFCEGCLFKLGRGNKEINCPCCEAVTTLEPEGEKGVKNLLPDIYLLGILAYNKRAALESYNITATNSPCWNFGQIHHLARPKLETSKGEDGEGTDNSKEKDGDEASSPSHVVCEGCSEKATCICKSCDDCTFCNSCFTRHHKALKKLQKHIAMPLSFPRKCDVECSEHNGRLLEFFDKDLDKAICALCVIAEKYKGHEVLPINELDPEQTEILRSSLNTAKEIYTLLKMSEKVIGRAMPDLTITANLFLHDVKSFFNKMHASLQIRESKILSEAAELFTKTSNLTSQIADCIRKQKSIESVIKEYEVISQQPEFLRIKIKEILAKLEEFKDMECYAESIDRNDERLKFVADEESVNLLKDIGRLEVKPVALFKMLNLEDVSQDIRNLTYRKQSNEATLSIQSLQENELLDEDFVSNVMKENLSYNTIGSSSETHSSYELVYVTFVRTPENFFVQRCSDKDRLQHLMYNLNNYCNTSDQPDDLVFCPEKDDVVCAQFLADNNWYRARIISVKSRQQPDVVPTWENGLPIEVHYIDYGNTESLPLARLRRMKPQFLHVPELAVPCSLVDIVPPNRQPYWPLNSVKAFNSLVGEKPMLMNIRFRFDGRLLVDLKRPDDLDRPTKDEERPLSVRDALIFLEVARFSSPESAPVDFALPLRVFKEPILPQPDQQTDVLITHVVNPHEIYAQKLDTSIFEIHEELAKLYSAGKRREGTIISFPYRNMICAAKFSEDGLWYRGLVTHRHDDCKIDVKFVDYGNSEKTSLTEIRKLPDACLNLRIQAIPVRLKDVDLPEGQDEWTEEVITFLKERILNKPMVMISKEINDGVLLAELCDTSTDEDVYINYLLVNRGFAISTGQSSAQNPYETSIDKPIDDIRDASSDAGSSFQDENSETAPSSLKSEPLSKPPMYGPPRGPRCRNFDVIGTFVDNNGIIFGHLLEGEAKDLEMISQTLNDGEIAGMPGLQSSIELTESQACVAQFSTDELWYRSTVVKTIDTGHVEVEFVDFGNREIVHTSKIRNISPFLEVPKQAVKLKLYGIEPVGKDGSYPPEAIDTLNSVMINVTFSAFLDGRQLDPDVFNVTIMLEQNENLGDSLVAAGLAKKTVDVDGHAELELARMRGLSIRDDYQGPILPEIGVQFDVQVTQVEKPNMVFVQRLFYSENGDEPFSNDSDDTEEIAREQQDEYQRMSVLMNSKDFFDDSSLLDEVEPGMLCCAQYSLDDEWYRGKIVSVKTAENAATNEIVGADVLFVDYGTFETVPLSRLRKIPSTFIDLPVQAICCELAGLLPPERHTGKLYRNTKWPVDTMKALYEIVANKRLIACIFSYGPPVKALLLDRIVSSDSETGERVDKAVAQLLANAKLGVFDLTGDVHSQSMQSDASNT